MRYIRARCLERIKPLQVAELVAARHFAGVRQWHLNCYAVIHFEQTPTPLASFQKGMKRLSEWCKYHGFELVAMHVWEAVTGPHVNIWFHCPLGFYKKISQALTKIFSAFDPEVKPSNEGVFIYICKGTDYVTYRKYLSKRPEDFNSKQGIIPWKRCGTTQNIGKSARETYAKRTA